MKELKIFLAGSTDMVGIFKNLAAELPNGLIAYCDWINDDLGVPPTRETELRDFEQVETCDVMVCDAESGGMEILIGFAYRSGKPIIIVGPRQYSRFSHVFGGISQVQLYDEAVALCQKYRSDPTGLGEDNMVEVAQRERAHEFADMAKHSEPGGE